MSVSLAAPQSVACHTVANEKRQRQDLARAEKLAREAQEKAQAVKKARAKRFGIIGVSLAAIVAVVLFFQIRSTSKSEPDAATSGKPAVSLPATAPTKLVTKDLRVGTGEAIQKGDTVRVKYVGVSMTTKKEFDSNWGKPDLLEVTGIGTDSRNVIKGWDGLIGAKVLGRRQLTIPAELAYGKTGKGPIGPNESLVFVVDIMSRAKG
jgi:peptidylprolyl isomerase